MRRWFVGMTALGLACGGDSSGPSAASVTGVAGDNQTGPKGASLPFPLSFTALGSDGLPIEGVTVTWSATPTGAAAFAPTSAPTDANGVASANVVLGTTVGTITMQATLNGVSPVVFHATVLDPCLSFTQYTLGQAVAGSLTTFDCLNQAWYYDYYSVDLPVGQQSLRFTMHGSGNLDDTFLDLYTAGRQIAAFDDDSILGMEGARNSQLDIILPGDTSYLLGANSFDQFVTGNYILSSETRSTNMNGCRQVWVVRGVTVTDSIKATDCPDSSAVTKYYDVARMVVFAPSVLTLRVSSTTLNPTLNLYQLNPQTYARTLVASNDDSLAGTSTNAFIQYAVNVNNFYDLIIGTSTGGETGAYTFQVYSSTTLSPRIAGSPGLSSGRNNWWRDVTIPKRSRQ
jgi:Big-like domain-containing protein